MRPLALVLALTLMTSGLLSAADANATGKQAAEFAKRVTLAVQAAKTKNGQFPASVAVVVNGKSIDVKVQVTPLAEGYSIKAQPAVDAKAGCPLESCNIDVNSDKSGVTIVSLVGTAADGSDIVAFATTGTELAVTVTQGDQTTTMTTTTAAADVPAQAGEAVVSKAPAATAPKPATGQTAPAADDTAIAAESVGKVTQSTNVKATVLHAGKTVPAVVGTPLAVGDVVSVANADVKNPLALDLFDGATIKLSSGTDITITSNGSDPVIAVAPNSKGAYGIAIDSGVLSQIGRHLVVTTPDGSVRTVGTVYSVSSDANGKTSVSVTSGSIALTSPLFPGVAISVLAGQHLEIVGGIATVYALDGHKVSTTTVTNGVATTKDPEGNIVDNKDQAESKDVGKTEVVNEGGETYQSSDTKSNDVFEITPPAGGGSGFVLSIDASPNSTAVSPH